MAEKKNSARAIAVRLLTEVLDSGAFSNVALRNALKESLSPQDNAFITDIVMTTLRNLTLIDYVIDDFSKTPGSKMKPFIRNTLRISVCQLRFMGKTPDHAAVNEAVSLVRANGFSNLTGFVNGVLRNIARNPQKPTLPNAQKGDMKALGLIYSYPAWLINSLHEWVGTDRAFDFIINSQSPPSVTIHGNTFLYDAITIKNMLEGERVKVSEAIEVYCHQTSSFIEETEPIQLTVPTYSLEKPGDITKLAAFKEGYFFVMDPGAAAIVQLLDPKPGETILDLCAAPGSKSFAMACLMENKGIISAFDIFPHKINLIKQTADRLNLSSITPSLGDALIFNPELESTADAVLLDAPCSGLGTIRKHPEIKYTRTKQDIDNLAKKQIQMLTTASKYVKPGGRLLYSTCTISKQENEEVIKSFLQNHPFYNLKHMNLIPPSPQNDGFFAALLQRDPHQNKKT